MTKYDAIIIGTGQAGPSMARRLAGAGNRVAIIERGLFGGTCINTGCTPTKAMVASAYAVHMVRRANEFGVTIGGPVTVDMKQVKARKDAIVAASRNGLEASLRRNANITIIRGHATFVSAHEVTAGDETLSAERIFIDVGGRPAVPAIGGLDAVPYLTSSTILALDLVPEHLVVIGGSYVGLEFAQIFRRFGSAVTVIESAPRLIGREDPEISDAVRQILEAEGIEIRLDTRITRVSAGIEVTTGSGTIRGSHLLLAAGRRPNTDDLGLEKAGVAVDSHGFIEVDDTLRTSVSGIWAMGECNGHGAFTHTAYNDFEIIAGNLLEGGNRSVRDRIAAYALFTDPPLGRAGMSERDAVAAGHRILVGSLPMSNVSRAYEKSETLGLMKIIVDADTKGILGAAILGTGGDEAVHSILDLMYTNAPYTILQRVVHIHPTVAEFIPSLLGDLKAA
ncbi:MAG: FAD-containing oxidoreductase [Rhodopila sp.]|jgi:pyruvate/2-oxoglutarate dehydrogenase complex dihydrolipoamide dehydrogenase (E3) component